MLPVPITNTSLSRLTSSQTFVTFIYGQYASIYHICYPDINTKDIYSENIYFFINKYTEVLAPGRLDGRPRCTRLPCAALAHANTSPPACPNISHAARTSPASPDCARRPLVPPPASHVHPSYATPHLLFKTARCNICNIRLKTDETLKNTCKNTWKTLKKHCKTYTTSK
jgi:hypothetical protein